MIFQVRVVFRKTVVGGWCFLQGVVLLNTSLTRQTTDTPGFKPFTTVQFQSCKLAYIKKKHNRDLLLEFFKWCDACSVFMAHVLMDCVFVFVFFILLQGFDPGEDTYQVCGLQFLNFEAMKLNSHVCAFLLSIISYNYQTWPTHLFEKFMSCTKVYGLFILIMFSGYWLLWRHMEGRTNPG